MGEVATQHFSSFIEPNDSDEITLRISMPLTFLWTFF